MAIKILSPQLANQIAAGEVVERPASVVKELVENSLDAGATKIQVDIENGGSSLIRIRDNGCGISKDELRLALARHATSKIDDLDDLESILTFGFRGEALASISSVSRLTLTSRTAEQTEAWQVYAQGREMETIIQPASHPVGTTVEVANLFFNTPARRKFLRTDKTEFAHIDEVLRRIALAKFNIAFTLSHNGKLIRQYSSATDINQQLKRIASICGKDFIENALAIDWKHQDLHLSGWVTTKLIGQAKDFNYSYVNGRMVKDKVITHAIRQAYGDFGYTEQYPAFVLFLDLNPNNVDVNVHPTKHEVRFHQARFIHDFIYQGVSQALGGNSDLFNCSQVQEPARQYNMAKNNRPSAGRNIFSEKYTAHHFAKQPTKNEQQIYQQLISPSVTNIVASQTEQINHTEIETLDRAVMLHSIALIKNQALLLQQKQDFYLLSLAKLQLLHFELVLQQNPIEKQPLLIPLVIRLTETQLSQWQKLQPFWEEIGFEIILNLKQERVTVNQIPKLLYSQNLQKCLITMLQYAEQPPENWLMQFCQLLEGKKMVTLADGINLLSDCERLLIPQTQQRLMELLTPIDWQPFLDKM